jgi:hypothetical protein
MNQLKASVMLADRPSTPEAGIDGAVLFTMCQLSPLLGTLPATMQAFQPIHDFLETAFGAVTAISEGRFYKIIWDPVLGPVEVCCDQRVMGVTKNAKEVHVTIDVVSPNPLLEG